MLVSSIAKLLANVSAPIAALFALGYLAQVVNIWMVARENYDFGFITAWHVASVIDKTVVIGIGLKYLVVSWAFVAGAMFLVWLVTQAFATSPDGPVPSTWVFLFAAGAMLVIWLSIVWLSMAAVWWMMWAFATPPDGPVLSSLDFLIVAGILFVVWVVVWLLMWTFATSPDGPVPSTWVFAMGGPTPVYTSGPVPPTNNDNKADPSSWWLGSILLAAVLAIVWLFFMGLRHPTPKDEKVVLSYLPYVNMTVTGSIEAASSIDPFISNSQDESSTKEVEGTLLSHNADYWYVFAEKVTNRSKDTNVSNDRRRILVIPADEVSQVCVVAGETTRKRDPKRDCKY